MISHNLETVQDRR